MTQLHERRRLRILIVGPSMKSIGGQSIQAELMLRKLNDEAALEVFFQPIDPAFTPMLAFIQKIKYLRTIPTFLLYCAQLYRAIQRCDVLHVFAASYYSFLLAPTPAIYIARYFRKPVILNYHSGEARDHLIKWPSAIRTMQRANCIVVPSEYLVQVFRQFGLNARVVHNTVDLRAFKYRQRAQPAATFLVNRNFEEHYNVAGVLRTFSYIQKEIPDASLTVAGDGPQREYLHQLADELSLRNTRFIGRVSPAQMPATYDQHNYWLNASRIDNMPLSILEAYACGLAIVTTNSGGIPYMVENNRTGKMVAYGDEQALAKAAVDLVRDPLLYHELTRNGLAECTKYEWISVKDRWTSLFVEMANSSERH